MIWIVAIAVWIALVVGVVLLVKHRLGERRP